MKKVLILLYSSLLYSISIAQLSWGTKIGQTYYDIQSNGSQPNNIIQNSDGSISVVWNSHWDFLSDENQPKSHIKGFGYNQHTETDGWIYNEDGECYLRSNGCATKEVGWPQIINLNQPNANGIQEMVFSHWPLNVTERENIGTGGFGITTDLNIDIDGTDDGLGWPRAIKSKNNTIHLIGYSSISDGWGFHETYLKYFRSTDGGVTWDIQNRSLMSEDIAADGYSIHSNGNNVAITMKKNYGLSDWILLNSTDNGNTWDTTIIKNYDNATPDTNIEIYPDTVAVLVDVYRINNEDMDILIDDNGKIHVFSSSSLMTPDGEGGYFTDNNLYKNLNVGIMYWNSSKQPGDIEIIATADYSLDGNSNDYNAHTKAHYGTLSPTRWPSASFDSLGNIYLIYSAIQEDLGNDYISDDEEDTLGYHDLYYISSTDNGDSWVNSRQYIIPNNCEQGHYETKAGATNIAEDVYGLIGGSAIEDDVYPSTVKRVGSDGFLHFTWQGDIGRPGLALIDDKHPNNIINYINYGKIRVLESEDCITKIEDEINNKVSISPNPVKNQALVSSISTINSVHIINSLGKKVEIINNINQKEITLNTSEFNSGVYLLNIETEIGISTKKLVIK